MGDKRTMDHVLGLKCTICGAEYGVRGYVSAYDAETGELVLLDSGSRRVRDCYADLGQLRMQKLRTGFRSMDVDQIDLLTGEDYAKKLVGFFRRREKMH